ncbi:efflux RND transporter periplasmic adaptor subunit [Clostridium sp. USBA 49]|uniref:efflux RND transporter periplasmic adaptor subunit n=1 Tax=Clostridium sp. USBA 49 TaxID=1881060 RepID=UPI0015D90D54|nr:efflux RND transporter periplasmic adaptor subunit [Clostridium sp. USBA 49]
MVGILLYILNNTDVSTSKTIKVDLYTIPAIDKVFVNGVITPENSKNIFLDSTKGSVNKIFVTNGQLIKKGDTLFVYKNDQITDQIDQLNKQIEDSNNQKKQLNDNLVATKKLLAKQQEETSNQRIQAGIENNAAISISQTLGLETQISSYQNQIDNIQNQIKSYKDQIRTLKEKEFTSVISSIDGKILLNDLEKDQTKPFIVIESNTFYIKGIVNEKDQPKIKENQSADILIFSTNKTLTGKVKSIGNRPTIAEASTQASVGGSSNNISYYEVAISLDSQENIINGFHVQATVYLTEGGIKIPRSAIIENAGKKYVFKVVEKKLVMQEITYDESNSNDVIVRSGLKENDSIAASAKDVKEGMSVE